MHRRSFLVSSGALAAAGAHLGGRPAMAQQAQIKGAGASFARPVLAAWADAAKGPTGVQMTYDPAGSNDGIAKVVTREVDFATTASPRAVQRSGTRSRSRRRSRPPMAARKRSCGSELRRLDLRMLKAKLRSLAKTPGLMRMRERSSPMVTSRL